VPAHTSGPFKLWRLSHDLCADGKNEIKREDNCKSALQAATGQTHAYFIVLALVRLHFQQKKTKQSSQELGHAIIILLETVTANKYGLGPGSRLAISSMLPVACLASRGPIDSFVYSWVI
jgi:hypothetical protein